MMSGIGGMWSRLSPKIRRAVAVGAILGGVGSLIWFFQPNDPVRPSRETRDKKVRENVLMDKDTRGVSLDSMAARLTNLEEDGKKKDEEISRLKEDLKRKQQGADPTKASDAMQLQKLQQVVGELQQKLAKDAPGSSDRRSDRPTAGSTTAVVPPPSGPTPRRPANAKPISADMYGKPDRGSPAVPPAPAIDKPASGDSKATGTAQGDIKWIVEEKPVDPPSSADDDSTKSYLPPGSIFSGTLLTGMDAPTGQNARKEPFPALLRIKHEAILPNRWRGDVKECFLLAGGYGDLSSERAYLRGETISCVTNSGNVIEANFAAYAVGEDGKAGIRGRLVSKEGQVIGRALMAGFLDGVSKAFDVKSVPVLSTSNTGTSQYADVWAGQQSMRAAALGGASSALDKIAQYYIEMAGNIFPIIEIDAGRAIDFIATKGISLTFRSKGGKESALRDLKLPGQQIQDGASGTIGSTFGIGDAGENANGSGHLSRR